MDCLSVVGGKGVWAGKKEAGKYGDYLLVGKRVKGEKR